MVEVTWLLLAMLFAGGAVLCGQSFRGARQARSSADALGWGSLAVLTAGALYLRLHVVPHHHAMYVDEPWYEEAAKNFLRRGALILCEETPAGEACRPYPKSAGWPAMLAIAFRLGGLRESTAFFTSATLGAFAAPAAAAVTRFAGGRWHHAIVAGAVLALHPLHLQWSATAETNAASITLLLCGLAGVLAYEDSPSLWAALLAAGGLGAAACVRPELWLAFIPSVPLMVRRSLRASARREAVICVAGGVLGAMPGIASGENFMHHDTGVLFQWSSIAANLRLWLTNVEEGGTLSAVIMAGAVVGAIVLASRGRGAASVLLGGAALLIGAFVLFYYPPNAFYARTMLGAVACAAPLAALALPGIRAGRALWAGRAGALGVAAFVAGVSWRERAAITRARDTQEFETRLPDFARGLSWPADALVLAEWPTVLKATTDLKVMATSKAIGSDINDLALEAARKPIYVMCDMFCEPAFGAGSGPSGCERALDGLALKEAWMIDAGERNYGFFRIMGPAVPGQPRPKCPRH